MEKISPPVRIFAVVIVLVGVAGMLAMRTVGGAGVDESPPVPLPAEGPRRPRRARRSRRRRPRARPSP